MIHIEKNRVWLRVLVALAMVLTAAGVSAAGLQIHCIDVGQGDCTLIISPVGGTLLFDGGVNGKGNNVIIPYLQSLGLTGLDYVSCSHYHADHIGGLDEVVNYLGIDSVRVAVLDRGWSYTTMTYDDYAAAVAAKRDTIFDGQVMDLGGGVTVTCVAVNGNGQLSPPFDDKYDENDLCVALLVQYGQFDFFVAGDLSGTNSSYYHDIETSVAAEIGEIEVYRVDHHGSNSNSNVNLVSTFSPDVSIVSCGDNSYGHPTQQVINRLVSYNSYIYQTELGDGGTIPPGKGEVVNGNIVIDVGSGSYSVNGDVYDMGGSGVEIVRQEPSLSVYPNPFGREINFSLTAPFNGDLRLELYDIQGRLVKALSSAGSAAGDVPSLRWDGRSWAGDLVAPGVYLVKIKGMPGTAQKIVRR